MHPFKRSIMRSVLGLILLIFSTGQACAQHLWPRLAYGMTPEEVLSAVPHASRNSDGAVELDRFVLADTEFTVRFLFRDKQLHQVHLSQPTKLVQNEVTLRAFDKIVDALRKTYGEEAERQVESESWGASGEATWRKADAEIAVTISPVTQSHSTLLVNFFYRGP